MIKLSVTFEECIKIAFVIDETHLFHSLSPEL